VTGPASGVVACGGAELHYLRWGEPAGRPSVVLVHGLGFVGATWGYLAERLAQEFTVFAVDRRDHGRSRATAEASTYAFSEHARDVVDFIDALTIRSAYGIGHSIGATDLLLAAAARPEAFTRLLALEPTVRDPHAAVDPDPTLSGICRALIDRTRHRPAVFADRTAALEHFAARALSAWHPEILRAYVDHGFVELEDGKVTARCRPEIEADMLVPIFQAMENRYAGTEFEQLARVPCPVSIVSGGRSEAVYPAMASIATRVLPRGTHHRVPHATHFWAQENPDELVAHVARFAKET
jgi:pimeloyl-ACP methyl ester carboxylesterase